VYMWGIQMDERVPSEVLAFAPKQTSRDGADPIDQAGRTVMAMVQQAASSSNRPLKFVPTARGDLPLHAG
jgi:hypothetical protein